MGAETANGVPETAAQVRINIERWRRRPLKSSRPAFKCIAAAREPMHAPKHLAVSTLPTPGAAAPPPAACCLLPPSSPRAHARLPTPLRRSLQAVLVPSEQLPEDAPTIRGHDFNDGCDLDSLLGSMLRTGLQATALGQAINEVNRMVGCSDIVLSAVSNQLAPCLHSARAAMLCVALGAIARLHGRARRPCRHLCTVALPRLQAHGRHTAAAAGPFTQHSVAACPADPVAAVRRAAGAGRGGAAPRARRPGLPGGLPRQDLPGLHLQPRVGGGARAHPLPGAGDSPGCQRTRALNACENFNLCVWRRGAALLSCRLAPAWARARTAGSDGRPAGVRSGNASPVVGRLPQAPSSTRRCVQQSGLHA